MFFFHIHIIHYKSTHVLCYGQSLQACLTLCVLWTVARQAPLSMGSFRQEYWSALPCPPPGDLPDLGIEPISLASPAFADRFFTHRAPGKPQNTHRFIYIIPDTTGFNFVFVYLTKNVWQLCTWTTIKSQFQEKNFFKGLSCS